MARDDFELANKAYCLMPLELREKVLEEFARLRYPSITDRFFDAVYVAIKSRRILAHQERED